MTNNVGTTSIGPLAGKVVFIRSPMPLTAKFDEFLSIIEEAWSRGRR